MAHLPHPTASSQCAQRYKDTIYFAFSPAVQAGRYGRLESLEAIALHR
ncbi:hypothetical protein [Leptolyngbya sp. PL-A3]